MPATMVFVRVLDGATRDPLLGASVRALPTRGLDSHARDPVLFELTDELRGIYSAELHVGSWTLAVEADGLDPERRALQVGSLPVNELFLLGRPGQAAYFRGSVRVPFDPDPDLLGVVLRAGADPAEVIAYAEGRGWELEEDEALRALGVLALRRGGSDAEREALAEGLRVLSSVAVVGPWVHRGANTAAVLTRRLLARFGAGVGRAQVEGVASELGLTVERGLAYAPGTYALRLDAEGGELAPLTVCARLRQLPRVIFAENLLAQTLVDHAITPTDPLYTLQWTHPLVRLPEAWQALRDLNPAGVNPGDAGDLTYGAAARVVGFLDTGGVLSDAGAPPQALHADLSGNVSDGNPKAVAFFDFNRNPWQADNADTSGGSHGTRCAGVAVASADNLVGGAPFGVAGAAGNARFLGVRLQQPLSDELLLSDAIVWAAGLPTGNPDPSFPAAPSAPAEILSLSFGVPSTFTSGALTLAIDAVSIYGRGGRGVLVVASAGNGTNNDGVSVEITAGTPLVTHPSVLVVGASSLSTATDERRASYSNTGDAVWMCAPSNNASLGVGAPAKTLNVYSADGSSAGRTPGVAVTTTTVSAITAGIILDCVSVAGISTTHGVLVGDLATGDVEERLLSAVDTGNNRITLQTSTPLNRVNTRSGQTPTLVAGAPTCTASFSGTSAATPLVSGAAALMLTARPESTWAELRDLLASSAQKIDAGSAGWAAETTGRHIPALQRHEEYGYGRLDAGAAVAAAVGLRQNPDVSTYQGADLVVRENLADVGEVPSPGWHPLSPDLWVENGDVPVPTGLLYNQLPPHQDPIRGQVNTIFVRIKNRGSASSPVGRARVILAHFPGVEFVYPTDWTPSESSPSPLVPASYLLDEVEVPVQAPGAITILKLSWPVSLQPPETVTVGELTVRWHPCLLVEISPQDGPLDTSAAIAVRRSNNLAQRNVTLVDPEGVPSGVVAGSRLTEVRSLWLRREGVPKGSGILLTTDDPIRLERWLALADVPTPPISQPPGCLPLGILPSRLIDAILRLLGLGPRVVIPGTPALERATVDGRPALRWRGETDLELPLDLPKGTFALVGVAAEGQGAGELQVRQRLGIGGLSGGYTVLMGPG